MFLSKDDAHAIAQRIIDRSQADACSVTVDGGEDHSLRFAKGSATTNLSVDHVSIKISSHIGQRIGSVTTSLVDDASLESARRRSEQIAQMLPIDPEYIAPLGPQHYDTSSRYYDNENFLDLDTLASCAQQAITQGDENNVTIFGCLNSIRRFESLTTSTGLFAFDRRSEMDLSITARTPKPHPPRSFSLPSPPARPCPQPGRRGTHRGSPAGRHRERAGGAGRGGGGGEREQ